ncbi:MAG: hypothetical protein ACO3UU_03710 [Minisyncoccia bacterium]
MADSNIKKARVPFESLPPINSTTEGYSVRYRIVSDDKNRFSHWSPIYLIVPNYTYVTGNYHFNTANQVGSFAWDAVTVLKDIETVAGITNKQLSSDIATITTEDAHYMTVGDWVTIEGVDSTFNGTYKIESTTTNTFSYYKDHGNVSSTPVSPYGTYKKNSVVTQALEYDIWLRWDRGDGGDWIYKERMEGTSLSFPHANIYTINGQVQPSPPNRVSIEVYLKGNTISRKAVDITNVSAASGLITYTGKNNFIIGDIVSITGVLPSVFNLSAKTIVSVSPNSFTISDPATGTYISGGKATILTSSFLKMYEVVNQTI